MVKEELDDTQAPAMTHGSNELRINNMFYKDLPQVEGNNCKHSKLRPSNIKKMSARKLRSNRA